jgi:hypothetical protein
VYTQRLSRLTYTAPILDTEQFRYQRFISDIAGQDIYSHNGQVGEAITLVRNWLSGFAEPLILPGGMAILERYLDFQRRLPALAAAVPIAVHELTYIDYANFVSKWVKSLIQV